MPSLNIRKTGVIFFSIFLGMIVGAIILILLSALGLFHFPFSNRSLGLVWNRPYTAAPAMLQTTASVQDDITGNRRNAIVQAAQKAGPAVVSISVVQVRTVREQPFFSPFGDQFLDQFWGGFFRPREYKEKVYGIGSGFIINPEGYILTNAHVVAGADQLKVTLTTGDEYEGKVVGMDEASDLAVVKIEAKNLPSVVLGNSDDLIIGEWAIAIGNPFGYLLDDPNPTVTVGVISAVKRDIKRESGQVQIYRKMIQTDAAINPGNSGGPLVNAAGEVVGINTFIFTTSRGSEGIGFAIPVNRAKAILSDLIKHGGVTPTWIGVKVQEVNPVLAKSLNLQKALGVIVSDVEEESPAQKAGLKRKDVIIKVDNQGIRDLSDWEDLTYLARANQNLDIVFLRDGKEMHANLSPKALPAEATRSSKGTLGMTVADITPSIARQLGISDRRGVVVTSLDNGGIAQRSGLLVGDVIRQVGDYPVENVEGYEKLSNQMEKRDKAVLLIERDQALYFVSLQL
ncbi:MAG: trypsin-like peptidase domain-containing protein [Candidatus Zixiibacteriota bacterium]